MYIRCINVLLQSPQFDPRKLWRHCFSTYYAGQHSAGCDYGDLLGNGNAHPRHSMACSTLLKLMPVVVYSLMYGHKGRFLFCAGIFLLKCNGGNAHSQGQACERVASRGGLACSLPSAE